jgi:hypothetical protein
MIWEDEKFFNIQQVGSVPFTNKIWLIITYFQIILEGFEYILYTCIRLLLIS